jgi:hypothetical protein
MAKKSEASEESRPMTKTAAVLAAINEGVDTPSRGVGYVKEKFGVEVTPQQFSIIKSQAKKKAGGGRSGGSERVSRVSSRNGAPAAAALARQVKMLVDQYGAEAVKDMAGVFAD